MKKNKKILIITIVVVIILVLTYFLWPKPKQEQATIKKQTDEVVLKWGNFQDNSSDDYINSLKPYFSVELFNQYKSDAVTQKAIAEKFGPAPEEKYEITSTKILGQRSDSYVVQINGVREFPQTSQKNDSKTIVTYKLIGGQWKITAIDSD